MADETGAPSEREKWQAEQDLKREELALKRRELEVREGESKRARWTNPLALAIAGAALAAIGNVAATYYTGYQQRALEQVKHDAELAREASKAESQLVLEVVKTANPDKAAENLDFLVKTGLITNERRRSAIMAYTESRAPGTGVALPVATGSGSLLGSIEQVAPAIACELKSFKDLRAIAEAVARSVEAKWQGTKTDWIVREGVANGSSEVRQENRPEFSVKHTLASTGPNSSVRSVLVANTFMWNVANMFGGPNFEFVELQTSYRSEFAKLSPSGATCRLEPLAPTKAAAGQKAK
jgi:hypothetical protein